MTKTDTPQVRFVPYNPYESRYPGRRIVSRETLDLVKEFRAEGYKVAVEPDDGAKLEYLKRAGLSELLSDPLYAMIIGMPLGVAMNIVSDFLYDLMKRRFGNEGPEL